MFNDSCSLQMKKGETVDELDVRVSYTINEDRKNDTRTTQLLVFDVLLNGIKCAMPTTYALVREISLVPCVDEENPRVIVTS